MKVAIIAYTPDPELTIAAAARLSQSSIEVTQVMEGVGFEGVDQLLGRLITSGHFSPFEHVSFTFAIEGISRVTSHQLVRHRLASYTQQSQRYVRVKRPAYLTPPSISARPELEARYHEMIHGVHQFYLEMVKEGIPIEDARYVLPTAMETQLVMTMNARELMHACSLRLCLKAQWEIVQLFQMIKDEVEKVAPGIGRELKPKCYQLGYCDEAESCGIFPTREELVKAK